MNGLKRLLVYTCIAVALGFIGVTIAFFAVNAGDEALSAEAAQMLKVPQSPFPAEENLYVALAGLDAPQGQSPIAVGERRIAAYDRIAASPSKARKAAYAAMDADKSDRLQMSGSFDCQPSVKSCWSDVESRRADHAATMKGSTRLYRRYMQLHATRGYHDTAQPSLHVPLVYASPPLRSLFVEDVALRVKDARTPQERSAALSDLDRDVRTWRAMLVGHGGIVSKFVAMYSLHGNYGLLADIIADPRIDLSAHMREIEAMLAHVAPEDWKIAGALDHEFRVMGAVLDDVEREYADPSPEPPAPGKARWWHVLPGSRSNYFRLNATKNLGARYMHEVRRFAEADAASHSAALDTLRRWRQQHLAPGIGYFHNPLGKYLLSVGAPTYDEYPLRAHEIAGFQRLVKLSFEIRKQGIADDAIPAFIRQHAWAAHPVSGTPFAWDAVGRELVMAPMSKHHKKRRFRIPVK